MQKIKAINLRNIEHVEKLIGRLTIYPELEEWDAKKLVQIAERIDSGISVKDAESGIALDRLYEIIEYMLHAH